MKEIEINPSFLKVSACVRYWDDAEVNGVSTEDGEGVPFKCGDLWEPVIDISSGSIVDWPKNTTAKFHFKVCDAGNYHLLNDKKEILISRFNNYVPDGLCHGDQGYGNYIIFNVGVDGVIENYSNNLNDDDWGDQEG